MIGEAYRVLSDSNLRADYDRHGKKKPTDEVGLREATEMFGNLFGGERFVDLIGEISLIRDFSKASEIMMSDEEREELEKQINEGRGTGTPEAAAAAPGAATAAGAPDAPEAGKTAVSEEVRSHKGGSKHRITPEQRQKLEALEKEKAEKEKKRVADLTEKLKDRIRPFVDAKNPGGANDSETLLFEKKMRTEAEDLKLESFGVELLHAIGNVYLAKSNAWLKTKRGNFLGMPGFWNRLKERGGIIKETWGVMGSAVNVQVSMDELARRQEKGDIGEDELHALEQEMSGKMLLATWRGTRWEIGTVLRQVCDNVLNEKGVSDKVLMNRARALAFLGTIYKGVEPDENDEERRELERLVAQAGAKKKKRWGRSTASRSQHQAAASEQSAK